MTDTTRSERALVEASLAAVQSGETAAGALRRVAAASGQITRDRTDLNIYELVADIPADVAASVLDDLTAAAAAGCTVVISADQSGSELRVTMPPYGRVRVETSGATGELTSERTTADLETAAAADDAERALQLLTTIRVEVQLIVQPPAAGAAWIRTSQLLTAQLQDGRWASTLSQLAKRGGGATAVLLVGDAGTALLRTGGVLVVGPTAAVREEPPPPRVTALQYRSARRHAHMIDLFEPHELTTDTDSDQLPEIAAALDACARATCWYWLATSASVGRDAVKVQFDGVRVVELDLLPYPSGPTGAEVDLASWAMSTAEPTRFDTVQRAVTFAVRTVDDLPGAAGPVLRTARSLYELATRAVVSEALAARRSSRDAATTAARAAATTARDVAAKAVERTLAVVVAAAIALFANGQKFLDNGTAVAIVATLAVVTVAALIIALKVDVASGQAVIDAFDQDVEQYRDALSEDDVASTRNLAALTAARADLGRAKKAAAWVYGTLLVVVLAGGPLVIVMNQGPRMSVQQSPTTRLPTQSASPNPAPPSATNPGSGSNRTHR